MVVDTVFGLFMVLEIGRWPISERWENSPCRLGGRCLQRDGNDWLSAGCL